MILLAGAHHDADLGCWRLLRSDQLALTAITIYHLAYVFCKLGCTAVVNEYKLIRGRVVLKSFVKEITRCFAAIGCIALNAKNLKLLNDCQVYERVFRYN